MCRGFIRTPSFSKMIGAYRSQWKRSLMRLFTLGLYGRKGIGWLKDPQNAWYNFWYNRTTVSLTRLLGFKPSRGSRFFALLAATAICILAAPFDIAKAGAQAHRFKISQSKHSYSGAGSARSAGNGGSGARADYGGGCSNRGSGSGRSDSFGGGDGFGNEREFGDGSSSDSNGYGGTRGESIGTNSSSESSRLGIGRTRSESDGLGLSSYSTSDSLGTGRTRYESSLGSSSRASTGNDSQVSIPRNFSDNPSGPTSSKGTTESTGLNKVLQEIKTEPKIPKSKTSIPKQPSVAKSSYSGSSSRNQTKNKPASTNQLKVKSLILEETERESPNYTFTTMYIKKEFHEIKQQPPEPHLPQEPDENTPKSTPKHENDQYIRKRMIIAGSSYCDKTVLEKLSIGTYFDLVAEHSNPYDKDAIMLSLNGDKIGYIPKNDKLAYITCLKLNRKVYGVITDIKGDSFPTKYEFETWIDNNR